MIAGLLLLFTLLLLAPVASRIPAAVLSGILITVGVAVMDYKGIRAIPNMPRTEVIIMIVVMLLSAFWNLVYAVGIGLVIASIIFMKKIGDLAAESTLIKPLKESRWSDELSIPEQLKGKVYINHIDGPLFFGSTSHFEQMAKQIPEDAKVVIVRMGKVPYIDQSGLYALEDVLIDLTNQGKTIHLVGLQRQPRYMLETVGVIPDLIPFERTCMGFSDCILSLQESLSEKTEVHA
jgi:SulP family sulfate permease